MTAIRSWEADLARRLGIGGLIHFDRTAVAKTLHVPCAVGDHIVDVNVAPNLDPNGTVHRMINMGWTVGRRRLVCPNCKRKSVQAKADRKREASDAPVIAPQLVPPVAPENNHPSRSPENMRRIRAKITPEQKVEWGRKGGLTAQANRQRKRAAEAAALATVAPEPEIRKEAPIMTEAAPAPSASDKARASKRAAMDWLSEAFDVEKGTFKAGVSDATIAKETDLAECAIVKLREEFFGPLGEPDELRALREELAAAKTGFAALAAARVEGERKIEAIGRRFDALCTKMGWPVT